MEDRRSLAQAMLLYPMIQATPKRQALIVKTRLPLHANKAIAKGDVEVHQLGIWSASKYLEEDQVASYLCGNPSCFDVEHLLW